MLSNYTRILSELDFSTDLSEFDFSIDLSTIYMHLLVYTELCIYILIYYKKNMDDFKFVEESIFSIHNIFIRHVLQ